MSIVSSTFELERHAQRDGSRYVIERHVDGHGVEHVVSYLARGVMDHAAILAARAEQLSEQVAKREFEEAIDFDGWRPLKHQTPAEFAARLRRRYRSASSIECARIATWILDRIGDGDFTENQVRNAFGLTAVQWSALKARLTSLRNAYMAAIAAQGE